MKKLSYNMNPVLRKHEEELHLKNMEKKIRAAKSSLPNGVKGTSLHAGSLMHAEYCMAVCCMAG